MPASDGAAQGRTGNCGHCEAGKGKARTAMMFEPEMPHFNHMSWASELSIREGERLSPRHSAARPYRTRPPASEPRAVHPVSSEGRTELEPSLLTAWREEFQAYRFRHGDRLAGGLDLARVRVDTEDNNTIAVLVRGQ